MGLIELSELSSSSVLLPLIALLLSCIITFLIFYARWNYGELERLGIPVVKPHFLLGSSFKTRSKPVGYRDVDWMKKYGQIFGVYEGREPQIYICDPDILRLIMVKDCSYFDAKGPVEFGDALLNEMPDYLPREKWRIVRSFTSPAFSSAKLRLMNFPMKESLKDFVEDLHEKIGKCEDKTLKKCPFDDVLFDALTDLTLRALFSIRDETGRFPRILKELANPEGLKYPTWKAIASSFPIIFNFLPPTLLSPRPAHEFLQIMENLIASRESPNSPPDVVDICKEQIKKLDSPEFKRAKMTRETILFQAFNFFFSGQDETALVISAMIYLILTSPDKNSIQEKLLNEVDTLWEESEEDGLLPREKLLEAEYLHACINESLRLYTFYDAERVCTKDWFCEKYNFTIPEGMSIMAPLWAVNRNPEYFENPEEFNPDRYLGENKEKLNPYAWSSFGHGPRHCTGKPLAMEVLRVVCAYFFRKFEFKLRDDSKLKFHPGGPWVFIHHDPIYFDIKLRK